MVHDFWWRVYNWGSMFFGTCGFPNMATLILFFYLYIEVFDLGFYLLFRMYVLHSYLFLNSLMPAKYFIVSFFFFPLRRESEAGQHCTWEQREHNYSPPPTPLPPYTSHPPTHPQIMIQIFNVPLSPLTPPPTYTYLGGISSKPGNDRACGGGCVCVGGGGSHYIL